MVFRGRELEACDPVNLFADFTGPARDLAKLTAIPFIPARENIAAHFFFAREVAINGCFSNSCRVCNVAHAGRIDSTSGEQPRRRLHDCGSSGIWLFVEDSHG